MTAPLTFPNVSPAEFQSLAVELEKETGFNLATPPVPPSGSAAAHGVKIGWTYEATQNLLTITTLAKPFFITADVINRTLTSEIMNALQAVRG